MVEILDEIALDLDKEVLQGWEMQKSAWRVANYIEKNILGERPPRVEVIKAGDVYQIVCGAREDCTEDNQYNYGGHHRSVAHYISGDSLDCLLLDSHRSGLCDMEFSSVTEISLVDYEDSSSVKGLLEGVSDEVFLRFLENCKGDFLQKMRFLRGVNGGVQKYSSARRKS